MSTFDASAQVAATNTYVSHMQTQADAAIARLTTEATSWTISVLGAVSNLSLSALSASTASKPTLLNITWPTYTVADFTGLAAPALPSAPDLSGAASPIWSETFWSNLKGRFDAVMANITSSDDVDTLVNKLTIEQTRMESALYARDYERKAQTLRDLYSAANAATGQRGFSFPNSMTVALQLDAQQKYQFDLSEISRTLVAHIFEWAKTNWQFAGEKGIAAHNADVEFNVRYLDTVIHSYSAQANALVEKYRADVAALVSKTDIRLKEFTEQINMTLAEQKGLYDIRLEEAKFDLQKDVSNADIAYKSTMMLIEDFKARVQSTIETFKANLADRDADTKNQIEASKAAASACVALAAGASTITLNTAGA